MQNQAKKHQLRWSITSSLNTMHIARNEYPFRATECDNLNLKDIMLKMKTMKALTKFIDRTGRLKMDRQPAIDH